MTPHTLQHAAEKTRTFRDLHVPGSPFILANAWDIGSARMLAAMGAKALATTSAGHAFTLGRPDMGNVTRDEAIAHAGDLDRATPLPVNGDLENGFGHGLHDVKATIVAASEAGLAGCGIEDVQLPSPQAYPFEVAVERIAAAVEAKQVLKKDFVITARADGVMNRQYDLAEAIRRAKAFEAVGADVVYVPLLPDMDAVSELCRAVSIPVNVLAAGAMANYKMTDFANAGVARVSLGSALIRVTHQAIMRAGRAMFDDGDMSPLLDGMPGSKVDALLDAGQAKG